jgi:POT family proton-dependent oligopeptide transporter
MFRKHPSGLPFLFFTEMWERFGYYLMIGIFTLYLKETVDKGGFGLSENEASNLYGTFIALVFLTPFLGGLLADRVLGYRRSITIGGLLMGAGYCLMAVHHLYALYAAIALVVFGNGFFKPNISTLLGNLYNEPRFSGEKDSGYNIFYMGINLGAFVCNFVGAAMYLTYGWGSAFIAAGIGMFIGIGIFWIGSKHYAHADVLKPIKPGDMPLGNIFLTIFLPALVMAVVGYYFPQTPLLKDKSTDAFLFACVPIIAYYILLMRRAAPEEKRPLAAILAVCVVSVAFWAVFKQNGAMMNTWAQKYTDREVPASVQPTLTALRLTDVVKGDSVAGKILDAQFRPTGQTGTTVDPYLLNIPVEERPGAGEKIHVFATNLSQSVNPFWVIVLTPLVLAFFGWLRARGKEPSTPDKIFWGLVISAVSMFFMIGAVMACHNGTIKASPWWFVSTYFVLTIGELFLSPMGLSLVSKLSPVRLTAVMMGGWFLATSIGNKMAGVLSSMWDTYDDKTVPFLLNIGLLLGAAAIILGMLKWLRGIFREND